MTTPRQDSAKRPHDNVVESAAPPHIRRLREAQRRPSPHHLHYVSKIGDEEVKGPFLPLRRAFIASEGDKPPPLSLLIARAGLDAVQLKTFLLVLWIAAWRDQPEVPYDADIYAKALDLPDITPGGKGARRVRDAVRKLEQLRLLKAERQGMAGPRTNLNLQKEDGSGTRYNNPAGRKYAKKGVKAEGWFIRIPYPLMRNGWLSALSGAALATWLILREAANYDDPSDWIFVSPSQRENRYHISQDTYLKGLGELQAHALVRRSDRKTYVGPGVFDWSRQENVQLLEDQLNRKPDGAYYSA